MDIDELRRNRKDVIRIKLHNKPASQTESKIGGTPYWPANLTYPEMLFLAQINLSEVPENDLLPVKGILQFFVGTDDCFGLFAKENSFKVIYHEKVETPKNIKPLEVAHSPILAPAKMSFLKDRECISYSDISFPEIPIEIEDDIYNDPAFNGAGDKLLGYPFFTQTDPREENSPYNTLLFQLDTSDFVMWGDSGIANFFINEKKLKNKDFSDILYNWDCC